MSLSERDLPRTDFVRDRKEPDFYLTHVIWRNSYGSFQPETGVRNVVDGAIDNSSFRLVQHGVADFDSAEAVILRQLRKGRDACRIATLIEWLHKRDRQRQRQRENLLFSTVGVLATHDSAAAVKRARENAS